MTPNTRKLVDPGTGEERLSNTDFTQIYHAWWPVQRLLIDEYPTALKVFTWLVEVADKRNGVVVSYPAMAIALGLNKRTIMRAVSYLVDKKLVTVLKSGNMNVYYLNDRIIWKDTANRKDKYSQFSAEVYIVASEQETAFRTQLMGHAVEKPVKSPKKMRTSTKSEFEQ
ncbi:MAG: helix-turn-helix domain-containing protein [Hymenobacter sp.]|nr:MAG: helix-turn-helix domain-containing protein [Hymenobacter sp.]